MLEEFSLRVKHFDTQDHPALESVHYTFIETVEKNAVALAFERDLITDSPNYSNVLYLYMAWKYRTHKPNFVNNLEKHGFVTQKQKEEILKKQRENALNSKNISK